MKSRTSPLIGAHILISQGFNQALKTGESIGCTALQIFTHSPRQWAFKLPSPEVAQSFRQAQADSSIRVVVAHAMYLINLASPDPVARGRSCEVLKNELRCCALLGIPYLVVHPGARLTSGLDDALKNCAQTVNQALEEVDAPGVMILIENMAGQGTTIGSTFAELRTIYEHITHKKRVGFCYDTCHGFAAGSCFSPDEFDRELGLENLRVIHVNDSAKEFNSRVDRHASIGQGHIGVETFKLIMNDRRLDHVAKILETPKDDDYTQDRINLELLQSLIE